MQTFFEPTMKTDQTACKPRLIYFFIGHTCEEVHFLLGSFNVSMVVLDMTNNA